MTYIKSARQLVAVARGLEPRAENTVALLADAMAFALHDTGLAPEDALGRIRESTEALAAAEAMSAPRNGAGSSFNRREDGAC